MKRDDELQRLISYYINEFDVKIKFKKWKKGNSDAEWVADDKIVYVYKHAKDSKTQTILDIVHEGGHILCDRALRKQPRMLTDSLNVENYRIPNKSPKLDKSLRKLIYEDECAASKLQWKIIEACNIDIPTWKLKLEIAIDMWYYRKYYMNGDDPRTKDYRAKWKQLRKKFKDESKEQVRRTSSRCT